MTLLEKTGTRALAMLARRGELTLTLPDEEAVTVGRGLPRADLQIHDYSAVRGILQSGLTGFAEAYMAGTISTWDLRELLAWGTANQSSWFDNPIVRVTLPFRRIWQRIRPERRHPRVRSMNDHYNLGNDFYSAWLDDTMTYSSARFTTPSEELSAAQTNKYRTIADHAGLRPGMRVLEIGCGWGGFAEYAAAERGCEVVGITLSEEQATFAQKRMANLGLTDRVEIRVQDFRDVAGEFDAVVSIEMIESVDEAQWLPLFESISSFVRPGGVAAMQMITIADNEWARYRSRADFIQQYIFPGGQLPAPKVLRSLADRTGLDVEQVETFGLDYARTLAVWQERFESSWPQLRADHGLDGRFRRMWNLYLTLCEAGFRMGRINVEQWVFGAGS
jgi:cyclopropane-fatty-acyl-phospholipid synthase